MSPFLPALPQLQVDTLLPDQALARQGADCAELFSVRLMAVRLKRADGALVSEDRWGVRHRDGGWAARRFKIEDHAQLEAERLARAWAEGREEVLVEAIADCKDIGDVGAVGP